MFCMQGGVVACFLLYASVSNLYLNRSHTGSQSRGLAERGQEEEQENEQH